MVKFIHDSPSQVPQEKVILVLSWTIVRMKVNACFAKSMMAKTMMNHADGRIRSLSNTGGFVNQVINLPRNSLTQYRKSRICGEF